MLEIEKANALKDKKESFDQQEHDLKKSVTFNKNGIITEMVNLSDTNKSKSYMKKCTPKDTHSMVMDLFVPKVINERPSIINNGDNTAMRNVFNRQ